MGSFFDKLQTVYATVYSHGLKKRFTEPKIYHGGEDFDLSKRWYVYYSFEHPTKRDDKGNPTLKRQTPIMLRVNQRYKTKKERLFHLQLIRDALHQMLKDGYSPYEQERDERSISYSAESALDFAFELKKGLLSESSVRDYKSRLNRFKTHLEQQGLLHRDIRQVDKKVVNDYLNSIQKASSARNRNNAKMVLGALFSVLVDNEIIPRNFVHSIKKLKSRPKRNKAYSHKVVDGLYEFLEAEDPQLLFFIKMVSYNFLRPIEVCRLQIKDIDLSQKVLHVRAKNKLVKTKIVPDLILPELERLDFSNAEDYLVTPTGVGPWDATETNRRDYFSKQFNKAKKMYNMHLKELGESLQLGQDHTIYSFRHTFITKLYRQLRKEFSTTETYDKVMLITGHSTLDALKAYLRDIDAELPDDYSGYLN
ncbi:site-specific integrase [Winogradskyella sp.]|uniref:tyrosine-type recombinase/integrase n=1 Tax=Winogradskyella sp. TaxID=1883156 RepID=UPI00260F16A8|nr:site-specific integrase [Winogradskyella sp.]